MQRSAHSAQDVMRFDKNGFAARDKHIIISFRKFVLDKPVCLTHKPAGAVSLHRATDFFCGGKSDTADAFVVFDGVDHNYGRGKGTASIVGSTEFLINSKRRGMEHGGFPVLSADQIARG